MDLDRHPELADRLAAAHALGTLRGGARRRFEALARQSPAVRARAIAWRERFAALTELQPAQAPDPNVWKRIENQLLPLDPRRAADRATREGDRLHRVLRWWRGAAAGAALAALALLTVALQLQQSLGAQDTQLAQLRAQPLVRYVAVLEDGRQQPALLVTFDPRQGTLTLKQVQAIEAGPQHSLQLWALPPAGTPRSLGVLGEGQVVRLPAQEAQVREVPALAVSLEPRGGAPAGSGPTGPVLLKGALLQAPV